MPNVLSRWWDARSSPMAAPSPEVLSLSQSSPPLAGMTVSSASALTVPAVFSCCSVLSQDVARTPLKLRQETAPDTFRDATDHPLFEILATLPNPEMTAFEFKSAMQWQLLTTGRAYAEIVRVDGRVEALWPLRSDAMWVDRDDRGRKRWTYSVGGKTFTYLFDASQPPILELTHESPIDRCRDIIGTALALQRYVAAFFTNGAQPTGVLQASGKLTADQLTSLREQWTARYGGASNAHRIAILPGGLEFKTLATDNDSGQVTEMMKTLSTSICGCFRIPPWKAGLMESTNYSNMASGENSYAMSTLDPFFQTWEEALRRDLLTARQYSHYRIQFDRASLVRNDIAALHTSLCQGIQNGIYSQNDARRALGLNPIPDGDVYMINSALQPVGVPHAPAIA